MKTVETVTHSLTAGDKQTPTSRRAVLKGLALGAASLALIPAVPGAEAMRSTYGTVEAAHWGILKRYADSNIDPAAAGRLVGAVASPTEPEPPALFIARKEREANDLAVSLGLQHESEIVQALNDRDFSDARTVQVAGLILSETDWALLLLADPSGPGRASDKPLRLFP